MNCQGQYVTNHLPVTIIHSGPFSWVLHGDFIGVSNLSFVSRTPFSLMIPNDFEDDLILK